MNDKPIPLVQVRNQRLFGPKAAARYLGIFEDTLKKITDLGQLRAFNMNGRRVSPGGSRRVCRVLTRMV